MTSELTTERRRQLLRATEDMVTAHRIEAITREHASIANLLDQREIFDLDEIQIKQGKFVKIEADTRIQGRRGARAETEIKPAATQAVDSFKEKGINVQLLSGGYDLELRIWKEKCSKPAYAEQRKFQYPELEDYLFRMTKEQRMEYKQKLGASIIKLAEKFRAECKQLKADMDLNGIFHPEANAHRVHCIYLTMLHKHISAKTVENPVLKEMYREEQNRRREEAARDEEKAQLLREMEERDRNAEKLRNRMSRRSMDMSHGVAGPSSPSTQATPADTASRSNHTHEGESTSHTSSKRKSNNINKTSGAKASKKQSQKAAGSIQSSSASSLPAIQGALKVKTSLTDLPSSSSGGVTSPVVRKEKVQLEPPEKSFKRKLRQTVADGQVTNVFNQDTQNSLLASEVSRLQQAEVTQFKRPKDRSDAWSESMSQWMLQDLQGKQVSRVAAGTVSNVGASLQSPVRQSSFSMSSPAPAGVNFADTLAMPSSSSATGAIYSVSHLGVGADTMSSGLQLQQQLQLDSQLLQRQQEQQEQWKAFGKAAVLAVDQFLSENGEQNQENASSLSRFQHQQHQNPTGGMRGVYSPSRYVPFDEFYDILKRTADPLLESALGVDEALLLPASLASTMRPQSPSQETQPLIQTLTAASTSSPVLQRAASMTAVTLSSAAVAGHPPPLTTSYSAQNLNSNTTHNNNPRNSVAFASPTIIEAGGSSNNSINSAGVDNHGILKGTTNIAGDPLNIVDVMRQEIEPRNFAAYEKVQDLTLPSAKLLARLNGNGGGTTHRRVASHLGAVGQTAIELRDSFGRLGRDANKGFDNLFSSQRLQEKGLLATKDRRRENEDMGLTQHNTDPLDDDDPFMDKDDIVRRLERTGDVSDRNRKGGMRASEMDAMLDELALSTNKPAASAKNSNSKSVAAAGTTNSNAATSNNSSPVLSRNTTPHRRHRAGGAAGTSKNNGSPSPSGRAGSPLRRSSTANGGGKGSKNNSPAGKQSSQQRPNSAATALDDAEEDEAVVAVTDEELDLQHKLVATWETLGVTANDRLSFMLKYSADVYAAEMSRAIDLWAGVAVCHVILQRLLAAREKAQQGLLLVPLTALQLWRHVSRPIPSLLRLNHEALIPPTLVFIHSSDIQASASASASASFSQQSSFLSPPGGDDALSAASAAASAFASAAGGGNGKQPQLMPYSVHIILRLQHALLALFARHNPAAATAVQSSAIDIGNFHPQILTSLNHLAESDMLLTTLPITLLQQYPVDDVPVAQKLLNDLLRFVAEMMQRLLTRCRADFEDEVPCGHNRYCKDVVQSVMSMLEKEQERG